ncbi:MAG: hypothetical protein Q7K43_03080 [Candidatus Woesearchaeota archaeon]|nr:hypothetical protein [Candidatus Woesearchaeota archaeon]
MLHKKEPVGPCNWCGTKLCQDCVSRAQGHLVYCDKCSGHLRVPTRQKPVPLSATLQISRRPVFTADGYLDLTR